MQTLQEVHSTASWLLRHPFSAEDQAAMAAMRAIVEPNKGKRRYQRDLLCAAGRRRNDRHRDGRAAGGDRTEGVVLLALFGPRSPFLVYAEERRQGRL